MGSGLRRARRRTLAGVSLLRVSQEYVAGGGPAGLRTIGDLAVESMDFVGGTLVARGFAEPERPGG